MNSQDKQQHLNPRIRSFKGTIKRENFSIGYNVAIIHKIPEFGRTIMRQYTSSNKLVGSLILFLLAACTPITATTQPDITTPIHLKVGYVPYSSYLPFYIAQEEGFFAEQGLSVELVKFSQQSDAIPLLVSGQIDVYAGPMDTMALNAIAQGATIKFVADKGYDNPSGCVYTAWVARQDIYESGVLDDLHNLAGMNIAYPIGQSPEYGLDLLLDQANMTSTDINMVDVSAPNRVAGLENGAIDITFLSEPFITQVVSSGSGSIWQAWETYMPEFQLAVVMYGATILENPDAGQRFMVAYIQAVRQYMDGKTDRNVELMATFLNTTQDVVTQTCWQSIRIDGSISVQSILDFQQWAVDKGYQIRALDPEEFWDSSYIDYANELLK
jgi:NitT/TauT family transport system substrate-binding protein